ncbi:unnamed protein product [Schistosoma rodhaini]|nr:unnamed protein product [Schistosoma rodhaini]
MTTVINGHYILCIILLIITLGLCLTSLSTDYWNCGNLFTTCRNTEDQFIILSMASLFILSSFSILLIILLDIICLRSEKLSTHYAYIVIRFILLLICAIALLIGVLLYTILIDKHWSYFCAIVGSVLVTIVVILTIMSCPCTNKDDYTNKTF